ncbi:MAG: metal-dependent hydrolase [Pseudobdellovibrionaceae bacterium]|nr:metal-dependent hydrolase [Pseudobdellovibrionaceae bacterium]
MHRNPITIRRLTLRFPEACDPVIALGRPEESFLYVGLSLLLPHLEPYLIRSMVSAKPLLDGEGLVKDTEAFIGQESQHYKMHIQFNRCLDLQKYKGLQVLVDKLAADYSRYSETAALKFNLAYAEGFEAFTLAMTRWVFQTGLLDHVQPAARDLFRWHLVEEMEHRTVAFDVYQRISGAYLYRLWVGLFAQWHLCQFVLRVTQLMLRTESNDFRKKYGGRWRSFQRVGYLLWLALLYFIPKLLNTHMPWYSPHRIAMPESAKAIADEYTEKARSGAR